VVAIYIVVFGTLMNWGVPEPVAAVWPLIFVVTMLAVVWWGLYSKQDRAVVRYMREHAKKHGAPGVPKKPPTRWMS
jgi:hypothetical protein